MVDYERGCLFDIAGGKLLYLGEPVREWLVDETKRVHEQHAIPEFSREFMYRSLWFCIASQRTEFERALRFARGIANATLPELRDIDYLVDAARRAPLLHEDRFAPALAALDKRGHIEYVAQELLEDPVNVRSELAAQGCNLASKTTSFWYLCLGGQDAMTLDVHNYRQLYGLGVEGVQEAYFLGARRADGRDITTNPAVKRYDAIEKRTLEMLASVAQCASGEQWLNAALATTLFWVRGVKMKRGWKPMQSSMLPEPDIRFLSPYEYEALPERAPTQLDSTRPISTQGVLF